MKNITESLTAIAKRLAPLVTDKWPANVYVAAVLNGQVAERAAQSHIPLDHAMRMQIPYILGNITHVRAEGIKEIRAELKALQKD